EIEKLKAADNPRQGNSGESVQHALLKIMEGSQVKLGGAQYIDTTNILFICGGAFDGLAEIVAQTPAYGFVSMTKADDQKLMDRLNTSVKQTNLFTYGLINEITGRLTIIADIKDLNRNMLVSFSLE